MTREQILVEALNVIKGMTDVEAEFLAAAGTGSGVDGLHDYHQR